MVIKRVLLDVKREFHSSRENDIPLKSNGLSLDTQTGLELTVLVLGLWLC